MKDKTGLFLKNCYYVMITKLNDSISLCPIKITEDGDISYDDVEKGFLIYAGNESTFKFGVIKNFLDNAQQTNKENSYIYRYEVDKDNIFKIYIITPSTTLLGAISFIINLVFSFYDDDIFPVYNRTKKIGDCKEISYLDNKEEILEKII